MDMDIGREGGSRPGARSIVEGVGERTEGGVENSEEEESTRGGIGAEAKLPRADFWSVCRVV